MRPMLAVALAAAMTLASVPALAEPAGQSFEDQTFAFEHQMGDMRRDLDRAVSALETREIAAKYQPVADAFADRIEARREDGLVTPRYGNARTVRNLPEQLRRQTDRARFYARGG